MRRTAFYIKNGKIKPDNRKRTILVVLLFLIPMLLISLYISTVTALFSKLVEFTYATEPDPSTFITANYSRLSEMADYYDYRYEKYHIPLNFTTDTIFTDENCTQVAYYAYSDNGAQYTGLSITGWIFKYVTAKNEQNAEMLENATRVIRKLVHGLSMLLAVPNGGIGPDYSGILARGYASPADRDIAAFYFGDGGGRHYNGTGIYSNWRWRGFTSNDEHSGYYAALALLLKYVDLPDVQETVALLIEQLANYMLHTNFLGMDYHGGPTGVDQKVRAFQGGVWALILLKMASIVNPEKYKRIYNYLAVNDFYAQWTSEGGEQESVSNYYAFAFGYHIYFALLLLEFNPNLPNGGNLYQTYKKNFENSLWKYTKTHRNPFYNLIKLIIDYNEIINGNISELAKSNKSLDDTPSYLVEYRKSEINAENIIIERDSEDILGRWEVNHFPDRALGHEPLPADYPKAESYYEVVNFLNNNPLGGLFKPIFMEVREGSNFVGKPLTPEYRTSNIFIWERNPWVYKEPYVNPRWEYSGSSFTTPYWMARAFGIIEADGFRQIL